MADFAYVRQMEDTAQGKKPVVPSLRVSGPRRTYKAQKAVKGRPDPVEGHMWHCWRGAWVSLPCAIHESDDWMLRAAALASNPAARFVYDPMSDRTLVV